MLFFVHWTVTTDFSGVKTGLSLIVEMILIRRESDKINRAGFLKFRIINRFPGLPNAARV